MGHRIEPGNLGGGPLHVGFGPTERDTWLQSRVTEIDAQAEVLPPAERIKVEPDLARVTLRGEA